MGEAAGRAPCFRISGAAGEGAPARVQVRLEERIARGVLTEREIDRVATTRLFGLDSGEELSEAFRRCCTTWEIERPVAITSHRPVVGPLLVGVKKVLARALRFQNEAFLARQSEFNRNLLVVLRELFERIDRRREP